MSELKKFTLLEVFNHSTNKYPDNQFISFVETQRYTYHSFKEKVKSVSDFLKNEGVIAGDRVAILSENQPNWGVAYFAITILGAVAVPIMTEFHTTEISHILKHSECKLIFVSGKYYYKIEDIENDFLSAVVLVDDFSVVPLHTKTDIIKEVISGSRKEFAKIKEAAMKFVGLLPGEVEEDNLAAILYTSGTTGHSKGVMLTHKNIVSDAVSTLDMIDLHEKDRMLSILPLFHTMETTLGLITPMIVGASVTYLDKPPTAAALLPALLKVKPTVMLSVPLVIEKIYRNKVLPEFNKKAILRGLYKIPTIRKKLNKVAGKKLLQTFGGELKMFCIGGAKLAMDVERFLKEAEFPYAIGYGLTETSPLITGTDQTGVRFRAAGKAMLWMEVKIDNPDPKNGEGEILLKGPNVMKGYYKDPVKTKEIFTEDGWFRSGDLGVLDKDGFLYIMGRSKNVIIGSNGKNIYPEELEAIINEFPFVQETIVVERNSQLVAKVVLNNEEIDQVYKVQKMSEHEARELVSKILAELLVQVNERVNTFSKISKIIEQPEPFEKTPTQKIKRYLYAD